MIRLSGSPIKTFVSEEFLHVSNNSGVDYEIVHNFGKAPHVVEVQFIPGAQFVRLNDYFTVGGNNYGWDAVVTGDTNNLSTWVKIWQLRAGTIGTAVPYGQAYCRVVCSLLN